VSAQPDAAVPIAVRPARPDELAAAAEVAVTAFADLGRHLAPDERKKLYARVRASTSEPDPAVVLVAVTGPEERVVGSIVYDGPEGGRHPLFPKGWSFFRSVGVDPAWRSRGVGRQLVEACLERARTEKADWLALYAADVNETALHLYKAMGFREVGDAPSYWGVRYRVYGYDLSAN
jgi:ribosomal protein S18 acetylase RimI-like enzyme